MQPLSVRRHRFPPDAIRPAVRLYVRFTPGVRDVEEMRAQRGIEAGCETIRGRAAKSGRTFARGQWRPRPPERLLPPRSLRAGMPLRHGLDFER